MPLAVAITTLTYVLGIHLNFDPSLDPDETNKESVRNGDTNEKAPFRNFARAWLGSDYYAAIGNKEKEQAEKAVASRAEDVLKTDIINTYNNSAVRQDIEKTEIKNKNIQLPKKGMQINSAYMLYGHFFFLKRLLGNVGTWNFYLDQDSGMRTGCLAAFCEEVRTRQADAFYVRINKDLTVDDKREAKGKSNEVFKAYKAQ